MAISGNHKTNLTVCLCLACILLLTAIAYYPAIYGGFVWDDGSYIQRNHLVKDISLKTLKTTFTRFSVSNYHPFTILSYAWEYLFFGLNPLPYHVVNIVLHLVNCVFVFLFLFWLTRSIPVAFITGLLFGIHPLHVESVAWISGRKDVLYTLFFMGGLLSYLSYVRQRQARFYVYTFVLCLMSLMAKSMAMSFPLVLFLVDYYEGRRGIKRLIGEKVPFFALSFVFGILALMSQHSAMQVKTAYSFLRGAFIASHGLLFYIVRMFAPVDLMPLYHYPYNYSGFLPVEYMLAPVVVVILAVLVYLSTRYTKAVLWGTAFYLTTVFPAIQLIPVGHARAADRYTYVPLIGIFFIVGVFLVWLWKKLPVKKAILKAPALCIGGLAVISLVCLTSAQTGVWKSNRTLWEYIIRKNPYSYIAYNNLGGEYHRTDTEKALYYYKMAAQVKPDYPDPFINICNVYLLRGEKVTAVQYCLKGLENAPLSIGIANACAQLGDIFQDVNPLLTLEMYRNSVYVNPESDTGYMRLCNFYLGQRDYGQALAACSRALRLNPDNALTYEALGNIFMRTKDYDRALANYAKAVSINPYLAAAHHNIALIYYFSKQYDLAVKHYNAAVALGLTVNPEFQKEIESYMRNTGSAAVKDK